MEKKRSKWGEVSTTGHGRLFFNTEHINAITQSEDGKELSIVTNGYTATFAYPNIKECSEVYDNITAWIRVYSEQSTNKKK